MKNDALNRALVAALAAAILLSTLAIAFVAMAPAPGENFTEFYILGPDGRAGGYPVKYYLGDVKPVIVGIVNHEYRDVTYDLVLRLNDSVSMTTLHEEKVTVPDGHAWEKTIGLRPDRAGTDMRLEFLLYADGNHNAPYLDLRLTIDVLEPLD